jgi:hypothetical protein
VTENVFLPVTTQMIVSISAIVRVPQIVSVSEIICVPQIVSIPNIVCVPQIVSILELGSGVSLVPHACDSWVSAIREWRDTIALRDSCYGVWTGTRERTPTRIRRPPVGGGWQRTHSERGMALA